MKITPALLNPVTPPVAKPRQAVVAVQRPSRTDDATGQADHRGSSALPTGHRTDVGAVERSARELPRDPRTNRALAAYAQVADEGHRSSLRQLLGFDAYA